MPEYVGLYNRYVNNYNREVSHFYFKEIFTQIQNAVLNETITQTKITIRDSLDKTNVTDHLNIRNYIRLHTQ